MTSAIIPLLVVSALVAQTQDAGTASTGKAASVALTYLANEGVLIESGEDAVLIDALFRKGLGNYARVPADELDKMEKALPPYDKVRFVLVTHIHGDHFEAPTVLAHLQANAKAQLISTQQVVDAVLALPGVSADVRKRLIVAAPTASEPARYEAGGLVVDVLPLSHGEQNDGDRNFGYIVHAGGKRILHVGDAFQNAATIRPLRTHAKSVDAACLPYWLLIEKPGVRFVRDFLEPACVIALHVPPPEAAAITQQVRTGFPDARVLTQRLERIDF